MTDEIVKTAETDAATAALQKKIEEQLVSQVQKIIQDGSGGQVKIVRTPEEAAEARQRMIDQVTRRLNSDPLVLELMELVAKARLEEQRLEASQAAEAPAAEIAPAAEAAPAEEVKA